MNKLLLFDIDVVENIDLFDFVDIRTPQSYNFLHMSGNRSEALSIWASACDAEYSILKLTTENIIKVASVTVTLAESKYSKRFIAIWNPDDLPEGKFIAEYNSCYIHEDLEHIKAKLKQIISENSDVN
mgnify:CR=1 FL=1